MTPSIPVPMQSKRAEIVERWKPSPPGTPEWEAQRNFDYARAHAHGDVKFLLEDSERLIGQAARLREVLQAIAAKPCEIRTGCAAADLCASCYARNALENLK